MAQLALKRPEHLDLAVRRLAATKNLKPYFRALTDRFHLDLMRLQNEQIASANLRLKEELALALSSRPLLLQFTASSLPGIRLAAQGEEPTKVMPVHPSGPCDYLILTATSIETDALIKTFKDERPTGPLVKDGERRSYLDFGLINGLRVMCVQSEPGSVTPGGSMTTVSTALRELKPKWVVSAGIAFGVESEKQPIGLILVSKDVRFYEPSRVGTANGAETRIPRGPRVPASPNLLSSFRAAELSFRERPGVKFGLLLSGEKLIDNADFRDRLLRDEPEAVGGEMEGSGLYAVAQEEKVDWIIVKAVCDYADGNKSRNKAKRQAIAAARAMSFVAHVIRSRSPL